VFKLIRLVSVGLVMAVVVADAGAKKRRILITFIIPLTKTWKRMEVGIKQPSMVVLTPVKRFFQDPWGVVALC